ncbi:MAG: histidinol-phosphate transaminase [Pseudomonadota bacterium]
MVFLANPGNPTGTRIPRQQIRRLRQAIPEHTLLVIDEAYAEFSDTVDAPLFDLTHNTQTIVLRTFSKAYGLAGLRVGWGVFEESVAEQVRKLLNPNNISALSQVAADACVQDQTYMQDTCKQTIELRDGLIGELKQAGVHLPASHTNFVLIPFNSSETADQVDRTLRAHGMVVRNMAGYDLPWCLRLTITNREDMKLVQHALLNALTQVQLS